MRRLLPLPAGTGVDVDLDGLFDLYAYPPGRPWVRANMVASVDGAATAEGRSRGLSGPADREVFRVLRALADVVVVGAGTVRAEGYGAVLPKETYAARRAAVGQPPTPVLAVVTARLDLDLSSPLFAGPARTVVLTAEAAAKRLAAARQVAEVVVCGGDRVDVGTGLDELVGRGHRRLLYEGGPRLLAQVAAAGRLDELCLTVSPRLLGGDAPRLLAGPALPGAPNLRLASLVEDDGYLLTRWLVDAAPSAETP